MNQPEVRFEVATNPEPDDPASTHFLRVISVATGEELEFHTLGDPYGFVEAWRENEICQQRGMNQAERMEFLASRGVEVN